MSKVTFFIDYFPYENSFLIPVYELDGEYYITKRHMNENTKVFLDKKSTDEILQKNKPSIKERNTRYIILDKEAGVFLEYEDMTAFKINTDTILLGARKSVLNAILISIGFLSDNLSLFDEISHYLKNSGLEKMFLISSLEYLKLFMSYNTETFQKMTYDKSNNEKFIEDLNGFYEFLNFITSGSYRFYDSGVWIINNRKESVKFSIGEIYVKLFEKKHLTKSIKNIDKMIELLSKD